MAASQLLHLLHDQFARKEYIDPSQWDLLEFNWQQIVAQSLFSRDVVMIIRYMPQCIPFHVRASLFQQQIKQEKDKALVKTYRVKIKRKYIFEDGYKELSQVPDIKGRIHVMFINELGNVEEGADAGGLFKEFLTQLISIVFNPDYGLFVPTAIDLDLFPNPNSRQLFGAEDINFYRFLGRILGKAVYDGITVSP